MIRSRRSTRGGVSKRLQQGRLGVGTMSTAGAVALVVSMLWYNSLGPVPAASSSGGDSVNVAGLVEGAARGLRWTAPSPSTGTHLRPTQCLSGPTASAPLRDRRDSKRARQRTPRNPWRSGTTRSTWRATPTSSVVPKTVARRHMLQVRTAAGQVLGLTGLMFGNQSYLDRAGIETMAEQKQLGNGYTVGLYGRPGHQGPSRVTSKQVNRLGSRAPPRCSARHRRRHVGEARHRQTRFPPSSKPTRRRAHRSPWGVEPVVSGDRWAQIWVDLHKRPSRPSRQQRSTRLRWRTGPA